MHASEGAKEGKKTNKGWTGAEGPGGDRMKKGGRDEDELTHLRSIPVSADAAHAEAVAARRG